jgi:DNA-binding GntR family transcriptional regulator
VIQNLSPADALGDRAYTAIREAITAGRLVPGTKLSYRARSVRRQVKEAPKAMAARLRTHGQIVRALKARDGERAEALARSHARDALQAYGKYSD